MASQPSQQPPSDKVSLQDSGRKGGEVPKQVSPQERSGPARKTGWSKGAGRSDDQYDR